MVNKEKIKEAVTLLLEGIGEDTQRDPGNQRWIPESNRRYESVI